MSTGGTLKFIQSVNNPEIIDASDNSLEKSWLHLPKLLIKMEYKLFSSSFKVIFLNSISDILGESSFLWCSFGRVPHVFTELSPD